jgi:hypothetical protein
MASNPQQTTQEHIQFFYPLRNQQLINLIWFFGRKAIMLYITYSARPQDKKVQQKRNSSKYLSAFLQAIRHQSRHPG